MALISYETVCSTAIGALTRAGVPLAHARLQGDLLIEAELADRPSHGLLRLPRIIERIENGVINPETDGARTWRRSFLDVDGRMGLGPVVADSALAEMSEHARVNGIAIAAIRNNNHLGMLGWYARRIASRGQVLIALTTSEALVHPWSGRTAMLGTNPIAIGVPTAGAPFVVDMATSLVSMGQIHDYAIQGRPIPEGWALDERGNPTTDAGAAKAGSIAPFGGAKGYALGLAFEVLVTFLADCAVGRDVVGTLDSDQPCNKGDVMIVVDPGERPQIARRITDYLDAVRASGDAAHPVSVPGDRAGEARRQRLVEGIELPDRLWQQLEEMAAGGNNGTEKVRKAARRH
ncbi:MAG TPA: Ldh family oxidoreductase [Bauldia sp.]|nr:Ldh family oxidoreductase [Bauldia sp.]